MKKNVFVIGIVFFAVILANCATGNLGFYDTSVPADMQCKLIIGGGTMGYLEVTSMDGNRVLWGTSPGDGTIKTISIPAGTHDFAFIFSYVDYNGRTASPMTLSCRVSLEPKLEYEVRVETSVSNNILAAEIAFYEVKGFRLVKIPLL
jgi:hypothetical protein